MVSVEHVARWCIACKRTTVARVHMSGHAGRVTVIITCLVCGNGTGRVC